jgi:phage terminase large subunit-like protein
VAFIEREMYIPETGAPMRLTEHQQTVLRLMFAQTDSKFRYSTMVYSSTKKSAKTTISAGLALWHGWRFPYGSILIVGNDLKQADSRLAQALRTCIRLNPRMAGALVKQHRVELPNGTVIESIPVDPAGEAGANPSAVFWTEAWAARHRAALQLWTETTLSPTRQGESFRLVESYAGYVSESPLLERLYETGVTEGARLHDEIEVYENAAAGMVTYWNTRYRLPWQTDAYYAQQAAVLTPAEYARVHENRWVVNESAFVPPAWWADCAAELPPPDAHERVVIGVDAAVSGDSFAAVSVSRRGDTVLVRDCRVFAPPPGGTLDFAEPERLLREWAARYRVAQITYDPYQLHHMMSRLSGERVAFCSPFGQGAERLLSDKGLYDLIQSRRIVHPGIPVLDAHVAAANARLEGERLRIVKRTERAKIDACVALAMAAHRVLRLNV